MKMPTCPHCDVVNANVDWKLAQAQRMIRDNFRGVLDSIVKHQQ
jgi:hypothetical protein